MIDAIKKLECKVFNDKAGDEELIDIESVSFHGQAVLVKLEMPCLYRFRNPQITMIKI